MERKFYLLFGSVGLQSEIRNPTAHGSAEQGQVEMHKTELVSEGLILPLTGGVKE
jgi:hypothetical protein